MNRFTISPDFFEAVEKDETNDYLLNVLFVFAQDNKYKICFDDHELAYKLFVEKIGNNPNLHVWLSLLNSRSQNIEKVRLMNTHYCDERDIFLSIADAVPPEKKLITGNKSLYLDKLNFVNEHSIRLIDGDETKEILNQSRNLIQLTYGDNSPIINGNNNKIR